MRDSFVDENGVERYAPAFFPTYEDRPAGWIRLVLGVLCVVFVWAGFQARDRAGVSPKESFLRVWLDYSDVWSWRFEDRVLPAYDSLVAGGGGADEDAVEHLFLGGSPFWRSPTPPLKLGPLGLPEPDVSVEGRVRRNFDTWDWISSPHERATRELGKSWDLAVLELVGNDPTTIDLEGLAALDPREFLTRLRAQEAVAREAMQRDYDSAQFSHRLYTVAQWAFFVLALGCIPAAVWVRQATLKAVRRDNERLRDEWRAYAEARRAAADREASRQPEPSDSSSSSRSITHSRIAAEFPVLGA